jgi:hypothetical protein
VVKVTDPYGPILGFLDRSRYFFFQVAPKCAGHKIPRTCLCEREGGKKPAINEVTIPLFHAVFLFGVLFDHEDEVIMFLRNVGQLSRTTPYYIPEDRNIHALRSENSKSYSP